MHGLRLKGIHMPECDGCHKDVKRVINYTKTGQWLCGACVTALEKPTVQEPPDTSSAADDQQGETRMNRRRSRGRPWNDRRAVLGVAAACRCGQSGRGSYESGNRSP